MNASELKYKHEEHFPESFFFSKKAMQFFGDTMKNYGVRSFNENTWELWRKNPVKYGETKSAYFNKVTFARVFPEGKYVPRIES